MIEQIKQKVNDITESKHTFVVAEVYLEHVRYLIGEVERLKEVEKDYKALTDIVDRARKLAYQAESDEDRIHFHMDKNGNLCRKE